MRIDELTRPDFYKDAVDKLHNAGYKFLGDGVYASAFQRKSRPNEIIKLFKSSDEAYMHYLEFVLENQSNPHFPKIFGKPMEITPDYYVVKMEKLDPVGKSFDRKFFNGIEHYLDGFVISDSYIEAYLDSHPSFKEALDKLAEFKKETYYDWDFHSGNVMWRNNTLVIIDPVYNDEY